MVPLVAKGVYLKLSCSVSLGGHSQNGYSVVCVFFFLKKNILFLNTPVGVDHENSVSIIV